ncbi:MAG TPA: hypothetical protein VLX91_17205 [Candidatus Acidoferrales bacterium]|nr:hypothetical protein [Candidatus Acidoferrales bacterium]
MKLLWFRRKGIFYLPASLAGWLVFVAGVVGAVYAFLRIDSHSHSASDTLINWVFYLLIIGALYNLIAYFTTGAGWHSHT